MDSSSVMVLRTSSSVHGFPMIWTLSDIPSAPRVPSLIQPYNRSFSDPGYDDSKAA